MATNELDLKNRINNIIQGKNKLNKEQMLNFMTEMNSLPIDILDETKAKCLASLSEEEILYLWHDYVTGENAKLLSGTKNLVIKNLSENKLQAIVDRFPEEFMQIAQNSKLTPKILGSFLDGLNKSANRARCEQMLGQLFRDKTLQKNLNMVELFGVLADKADSLDMLGDWGQKELSSVLSPYILEQNAKNNPKLANLFLFKEELSTAKSFELGKIKIKDIDKSLFKSRRFLDKIVELSRQKFIDHFDEMTAEYAEQGALSDELKAQIAKDLKGVLERLNECKNEYLKNLFNENSKNLGDLNNGQN